MSRYILFLIILLKVSNCLKREVADTFLINPNTINEKEINIQSGKEFCIKLSCVTSSYVLLNKNENDDAIPFLGSDSIEDHYEGESFGGRRGYLLYYFNAKSITKESRLLKFTDTYSYLRQQNPVPKLIVKVNVVE